MKDFFVSFSGADKAWAEWIGWQLLEAGYSVELQGWTWGAGANFPLEMDRAARETRRTVLVLSPSFLRSVYAAPEWAAAFREDPKGLERRLVPVKVRPCAADGLLGSIVHIDLVGEADPASARRALLEGLEPPGPPDEEPAFPGGRAESAREEAEAAGLAAEPPAFPGALPPHFNVPHRRNPHFTGREDLLTRLEEVLRPAGGSGRAAALTQPDRTQADRVQTDRIQTLRGLGGVGKTQLALEYAYRHASEYRVIWWVRAEDSEILVRDLATLAEELGLVDPRSEQGPPDPQVEVAAVRRWLETHGGWLLVFDNAEDPAGLEPYLPRSRTGPVLITSRRSDWDGIASELPVDVLPLEEAVDFLLERTAPQPGSERGSESAPGPAADSGSDPGQPTRREGDDAAAARSLARELGCLPLALEQAGAFIRESGTLTLAEYEKLFRERRSELLGRGAPRSHREEPVETTWDLSFEKLEREVPEAGDLLRLLSFFAPEDLPLELLPEHADLLPEPLSTAAADRLRWHDVKAAARRLSLLEIEAGDASIHRLVQTVLRDRMSEEDGRTWAEAAVRLLNAGYGYQEHDLTTWDPALRLLAHVAAATRAAEELDVAPKATGRLLNNAGLQLLDRGVLDRAEDHLERALEIAESVYGPEHPTVAIRASNLGQILKARGDLSGAEDSTRRALAIDEAVYGPEHPTVAIRASNLATILQARGDLSGAEELTRRALGIDEAVYGPEHPEVATDASNLGQILRSRGDLSGAEELTRRALAIFETAHGEEHPNVATLASNLGQILKSRGDFSGAEELTRRALAIDETVYGPEHPSVAIRASNLGQILQSRGDLSGAEDLTRRALAIDEAVYGPEHPEVATDASNLGQILKSRGDLSGAEELTRRALAIDEAVYGPEHPEVATDRNNLAGILRDQGHLAAAEAEYRRAVKIAEAILGADNPSTKLYADNLARLLKRREEE